MSDTPPLRDTHRARKRFGQNFLHDEGVVAQILRAVHPTPGQHLVEIGPGQAALTGPLLASGCQLDAIELDRDLAADLRQRYANEPRFRLIEADALRVQLATLAPAGPLRVVGNLPYNISTPLLFHLFAQRALIADMHFMLQKEVVERMAAGPGSKTYGRLSVMAQFYCDIENLFGVPPGAFRPAPKVHSAVVRLTPHRTAPECDPAQFARVVTAAFAQRRKTLRNTLKAIADETLLAALDIDPGARAETLTLADFIAITNRIPQVSDTTP